MTAIKTLIVGGLTGALMASVATAQSIVTTDDGLWRYLESNEIVEIVEIPDWPDVRDRVLADWQPAGLIALPIEQLAPIGAPDMPANYRATGSAAEVLHLESQPQNPQVRAFLAQLFSDIGLSDLDEFNDGARIEVVTILPDLFEITVMFLSQQDAPREQPSTGNDSSLAADLTDALRATGKLDEDLPGLGVTNPFLYVNAPLGDVSDIVERTLQARDVPVQATPMPDGGTQFFGLTEVSAVMVMVNEVDSETTQVTLMAE
ncbi:hypothetical protein [Loktanella sp. SALINAS62]|uniref:hypothetical protein n=1 Tax=Loktanella sp. SALINAS62 TaxID=2706124 RepID=UPI001B8C3939|nr:hypothetical protein [Loktanella sp. SALINAS62]MBS1301210.1 hypothetical protein [Loktanella sp. SALINAS62]